MSTFFFQQSVLHGLVIYLGFAIVFRHPAADVLEGRALGNGGAGGQPGAASKVAAAASAASRFETPLARPLGTLMACVDWPTDFFPVRVLRVAHAVLSHDASAWSRSWRIEEYWGAPRSVQDASVMMH